MDNSKLATYSLLAHINNSGTLISDLTEIFVPLVKRTLSAMISTKKELKGKNISEIKRDLDEKFKLDIPIPLLRKILKKIARELNTESKILFDIYNDDAYYIHDYVFVEFEEVIKEKEEEIRKLEILFKEFCTIQNVIGDYKGNIFGFIEKNKLSISKYLSHKYLASSNDDHTIEAQFVDYFKNFPDVYEVIRNIYLGSIISSYLEYETTPVKTEVELLFDTNFIIGLLDLKTPESTHTCNKLLEIVKSQGFKLSILDMTVTETTHLLENRARNFDKTFLAKKIDPEDIYNACERKGWSKTDLERVASNIEDTIRGFGIYILPHTEKLQNLAKATKDYDYFKNHRINAWSALHDATVLYYVRSKRGKKIKDFEKVNCWFVNNSSAPSQHYQSELTNEKEFQEESIKAEDLLNILWLSNPNIKSKLQDLELVNIGLARLVSCTLHESLPKASIIKELDENIQKYAKEKVSDKDILYVASRIANRNLKNIESLNALAKSNETEFVKRLKAEAEKEKELEAKRAEQFNQLIEKFYKSQKQLDKVKDKYEKKFSEISEKEKALKEKEGKIETESTAHQRVVSELEQKLDLERRGRLRLENEKRKPLRDKFMWWKIFFWRLKTFGYLFIGILVFFGAIAYLCSLSDWDFKKASLAFDEYKGNILVTSVIWLCSAIYNGIFIKRFSDQFGQSNINALKLNIEKELPNELKDLLE